MKKLVALCAILFAAIAVSITAPAAHAATDVTGDWTAQMQGPNGDMTLTFHFKQDGAKLTGTVDSPFPSRTAKSTATRSTGKPRLTAPPSSTTAPSAATRSKPTSNPAMAASLR